MAATAREQPSIHWSGFAQFTSEYLERPSKQALEFSADRVRIGVDVKQQKFSAKIQIDVNAKNIGDRPDGGLPNLLKHAHVSYQLSPHYRFRLGQQKTPLGMDFNRPGSGLDITKRGLEKSLVLEFAPGAVFSGQALGIFGFDLGVFSITSRSGAVATAPEPNRAGSGNSYVGRISLTPGPSTYMEAAWGHVELAGGPDSRSYQVWDLGAAWNNRPWTLRMELISGSQLRGIKARSERTAYLHVAYWIVENLEFVVRHYQATHRHNRIKTELGNSYLGINFHPISGSDNNRLQLNIVIASGDKQQYQGIGRTFTDHAILGQWQLKF